MVKALLTAPKWLGERWEEEPRTTPVEVRRNRHGNWSLVGTGYRDNWVFRPDGTLATTPSRRLRHAFCLPHLDFNLQRLDSSHAQ